MQRAARTGLLPLVSGITLVTAIVCIYGAVAGAELTNWDDDRFLTYNPLFHSDGLTYLYAALTRVQFEAYQPLHLISYLPDHYLWPDWPSGFHLVNVALFVVDIVLLLQLVRRHASGHAAFAAAALFALHPVCVEPVAWVTARKDLVMMLFFVLALRCEDEHHGPRPSLRALVFTLCALLSKSASACLPIVVFAWLRWVQRRPLREALVRSAGHAVLALAVSVFVYAVWRDHAMIASVPLAQRPLEVAATLATYTAHVAWPVDLAAVYPDRIAHPIAALIACAVAAAALAAGWRWLP